MNKRTMADITLADLSQLENDFYVSVGWTEAGGYEVSVSRDEDPESLIFTVWHYSLALALGAAVRAMGALTEEPAES